MPNDWIEEEAERILTEKHLKESQIAQHHDTQTRIRHQWDQMRQTIRENARNFNSNEVIQERYGRKLEIDDDGWSGLQINSTVFPAIYMKIHLEGQTLKLKWNVITPTNVEKWTQNALANLDYQKKEEFTESLEIVEAPDNLLMFSGPQGRQSFSELPMYVLSKFLVDFTRFQVPYLG